MVCTHVLSIMGFEMPAQQDRGSGRRAEEKAEAKVGEMLSAAGR